jgi:misacylated tRNA(Ala) deacylase
MTELLYLPDDDDTTEFTNTVTEATYAYIVLEGTYFYPEGGGQPSDTGTLRWADGEANVTDVRKNHGDVHHRIELLAGSVPGRGTEGTGVIDKNGRTGRRRRHAAQHVRSRVVLDE